MVTITTQYTTNDKGAGKIVAKGGGKQRTVAYDHSLTPSQNHGAAAGTLGLVLGFLAEAADITHFIDAGNGRAHFQFLF